MGDAEHAGLGGSSRTEPEKIMWIPSLRPGTLLIHSLHAFVSSGSLHPKPRENEVNLPVACFLLKIRYDKILVPGGSNCAVILAYFCMFIYTSQLKADLLSEDRMVFFGNTPSIDTRVKILSDPNLPLARRKSLVLEARAAKPASGPAFPREWPKENGSL